MSQLQDEIEVDLEILGVTAIEDKLQDEVGEVIELLREANIKVWVLTGDKHETAINIGFACKLLDEEMVILYLDEANEMGLERQLKEVQTELTLKQQINVKDNLNLSQ